VSEGLLGLAVIVPFVGATVAFLVPRRVATLAGLGGSVGAGAVVGALVLAVAAEGTVRTSLGGWTAPLGIELVADGLAAGMLLVTAMVGVPVSLFAMGSAAFERGLARATSPGAEDADDAEAGHERGSAPADHAVDPPAFWPRWLFLWASLNALFLSADVFNVYVTLELVTLSAVGLVLLSREQAALVAGLRYLLVAFLGSVAYLLGVAMLYGATGTLAFDQLAELLPDAAAPAAIAAIALLTVGLAVKSALLPFHAWLPPAHSRAPAPASAVLSGLVVMAGLYLLVRLWLAVAPNDVAPWSVVLAAAGIAALVYGSIRAVRAPRVKLLLAWSTVAQVGLIVLAVPAGFAVTSNLVPVAARATTEPGAPGEAWAGMALLAGSHALAKASLFLVAGLVVASVGHDRLGELGRPWRAMPLAMVAAGLAGASLLGLPGTGGEAGKHLLADLARDGGAGWLGLALDASTFLTATYLAVLAWHLAGGPRGRTREDGSSDRGARPVPWRLQAIPFGMASLAVVAGLATEPLLDFLRTGAAA
jgi:multicomponent Na+:H+ antiporter subunit D